MATLEHVSHDGRDHYRLRFSIDRRRKTVSLGDFDEAAAVIAKEHVEHLLGQVTRERPPSPKTSAWLDTLPIDIHDRISALGLCDARERCELPRTVLAYMRAYIASRTDWKKPENYRQSVDHLERFLRRDIPITSLTKGEADRWHRWMQADTGGPSLSPNTAGQHVKRCRQMMRQAIDDRLLEANPFKGIKIDLRSDTSKNRFIDEHAAVAIIDACPDQEWRSLFALGRYGGLRCPSEVLRLRWSDIQWDRERFKVTAPKTERYGKGSRIVPLWPELRSELDDLSAIVGLGVNCASNAFVIQRYRDSETNLRTTFNKIVARAGIEAFPKPFMALRASRRTELERSGKFANHVLNDWFGHSGAIAETHYLQTTEADFIVATETSAEGTVEGTSATVQESSRDCEGMKKPGKNRVKRVRELAGSAREYTRQDSNL